MGLVGTLCACSRTRQLLAPRRGPAPRVPPRRDPPLQLARRKPKARASNQQLVFILAAGLSRSAISSRYNIFIPLGVSFPITPLFRSFLFLTSCLFKSDSFSFDK